MTTKITVSGPGSVINFEVEVIRQLLESLGYKVILENPHPFVPYSDSNSVVKTLEDYLTNRKLLLKKVKDENLSAEEIILQAQHIPWGG